jgi:hypothetical protein
MRDQGGCGRSGVPRVERLAPCKLDERRVRKIHGHVGVLRHDRLERSDVAVIDWKHGEGSRAQESPSGAHLVRVVAYEVEELGQHGSGRG